MALEAILPIFVELFKTPITKYIISPIKRHISYAFKCESKIQSLHDEVVQLKDKKDRLDKSVAEASRNGEEIFDNVTRWLSSVENDIEEAEKLILGKEEAQKKCFVGVCPNLKTRYQLSKNADKKALAIGVLVRDADGFGPISFRPLPEQIVEPSVYSREALPSRMLILNQIMDALKDPNLNMIGVHGMGGVGKTTLAKEVQAKAVEEKLFETVVMVAVSQTPELRRIQAEIADFLGLKFDVEEVPGRASQLYKRLKKSKVLIILDDLWQKLELNAVGIPSESCKLLLTSRSMDVLCNEMGTQKEFSLGVLGEEEAWSLFQTSVAKSKDPQLHAIAAEVAKKCAGLPLLIIIVAKELQNKELYAWVDMQKKLSGFGNEDIHRRVHKVLESSFENLPGEEVKSLFLLCSLFAQSNIEIQCLLIYSMGLGLFKHIFTIGEARNRLSTLIDKLKAECLLLDGDKDGYVKMHDVVRDAAIAIASRLQNAFVGAGQVRSRDWPNQNCTRISLPYCDVWELPTDLDCAEADLFLLFTEDLSLEIPDSFFKGLRKLKVVDFTGMRLVSLPSSLGFLTNLSTLSLNRCWLGNVAVIGELKQLELLSFADSKIVELPREIEQLTQLKLLDLRNCSRLKVIPANVFSKLCLLEELYMLKSFDGWDTKGNVSLLELENLFHLSTLEIQILNPKLIPKGCWFFDALRLRLRSYKISIGDEWEWNGKYESSRTLKLKLEVGNYLGDWIEVLRGTEDLYLDEVRGIDLDGEGFPQLKHLHIQYDSGNIKHLIKPTRSGSCQAFAILESLDLSNLKGLEKICDVRLAIGSFGKLQSLKISYCHKLKYLLSYSSAKCMLQLQEMEVYFCDNIETIVGEGSEDGDHNNEVIEFTQLNSLKLNYLPHLIGFCRSKEGIEEKGLLFNEMVSFPNLTSIEINKCNSLKYVFTTSMVKCPVQLKKIVVRYCELVEEIILTKKSEEIEERISNIVFPKLDCLQLYGLPNAKWFGCGYPIEFPLLRELNIYECPAMENFVSKFPDRSNNNGSDEYLFNEMVTFSKLEIMHLREMSNFRYLWDEEFIADDSFSKLKSLTIGSCSKLSVVFPSNVCRRFQRLEKLSLYYCGGVKEIYQYEGVDFEEETFALRDLRIENLESLKHIWSEDHVFGASTFENLQTVSVSDCEDLKYLFPSSIASGLLQLQQLLIRRCGVEMIIAKINNEELKGVPSFKFPQLTFLRLMYLNEMRSLYEGPHTLEWPKLKRLEVCGCHEIMKFEHNLPIPQSPFFADQKFIPNLEKLTIDDQSFKAIHQGGAFPAGFFSKVKKVNVESLEEESVNFLCGFLKRLYSLETLVFQYCSLEEISLLQDERQVGEEEHPLRIRHLKLSSLGKLKHITKKESQINSILQYLQTLKVKYCYDLKDIALSSTSSFQNLTTLYVYGCENMTRLVTTSTAKTMVQLVQMKVQSCKLMEEIVADDGDFREHDAIIFNKLKCLELIGLKRINSFCSGNYTINFPLLEQVTVKSCSRMKIFCGGVLSTPKLRGVLFNDEKQWEGDLNSTIAYQLKEWVGGHFEEGRLFQNVESLEVVKDAFSSKAILANQLHFLNRLRKITVSDCDSLQVVFDLEGLSTEDGHVGLLPQLTQLQFINLPMLNHLCNKPPTGILGFNKLQVLKIENCSKLTYAFTWSMASCLFQLREIELKNCDLMERIIKGEKAEDTAKVILRSLNSVVVECLPKFSFFYSGSGDLECPSLEKISIRKCSSIKAFTSRLPSKARKVHKVFPNLKELLVDMKSIGAILQFEFPIDFFSGVKKFVLQYCSVTRTRSHAPLFHFLSRLPNLVELEVCDSSFKELFKFEGLCSSLEEVTELPQIRDLKLQRLDDLKLIWWRNSQLHSSLFQSIKTLKIGNCGNLIDLASSSTSFGSLTTLEVYRCNKLINLITPSLAKSMVQLERLSVKYCDMLTEVVGDGNDGTTDEIAFTNMKTLELIGLQSLKSFSLGRLAFKFPCLKFFTLDGCPNLRNFCAGIITTPMLEDVKHGHAYEQHCYWEGDLNATIQQLYIKMIGFKGLGNLKLSKFPMLKEKWGAQFPFKYFRSLQRLVVDDCALFSNAISSHLLKHLVQLKVLTVEKCDSVEQVFDLEVLNGIHAMKDLSQLQLIDLPRLRHAWSKDPQQILSFKNLELLEVHNCDNLTYIFNLSMALRLPKLQHVEVKKCSLVEHIIVKAEEETIQEYQTIFPSLQSINLQYLTNLSSFCSASGFLECPSLKVIEVVECPNMKFFHSTFLEGQDSSMIVEEKKKRISNKDPDSMAAILGNKIAIPRLEELKIEWNSLKDKLNDNNQPEFLSKLKVIELTGFRCEYAILPSNFLQNFPKLEKLALSDDLIEEINLQELSFRNGEEPDSLALLTKLKLSKLPKLRHMVHDDCHLVPLFQNLEDLEVIECSRLKILVPSSVSFQNLTSLQVSKCDGLMSLITASTARSLVQLKKMIVKECKMMKEIVAIPPDGLEYEIHFSQLECLELDNLPCFASFCSGNYDFYFPSLEEMVVIGCPNMKSFASSVTPKLKKVKTGRRHSSIQDYDRVWVWEPEYHDTVPDYEWEGSLNNTIRALYMEKDAEETNAQNM